MSKLDTAQPVQPFRVRLDVKVPMRDGVLLSTDIYLPNAPGPFPTLLLRTIYDNQWDRYLAWAVPFIERGYAVAMQDCRGRHDSDGAWEPYIHETEDGYDTHEWLGAQPWCDGTIGMFGVSYLGFTQTLPGDAPQPLPAGAGADCRSAGQLRPLLRRRRSPASHRAQLHQHGRPHDAAWQPQPAELRRALPAPPPRLGAGRHRRLALLSAGHRALHVRRVLAEL